MTDINELLLSKAKEKNTKILLVEGEDPRVIKAAALAAVKQICTPLLLGNKQSIENLASKEGIELSGIEIVDPESLDKDTLVQKLVELRKHKGMTEEKARETLEDPNALGALLLKTDFCDGALGGCKFSTAEWMRPVFQIVGKAEGVSTVSAVCILPIKDKTFFIGDTDFIIKPTTEELAQIAMNAAKFAKDLGFEPKVALLSYSTHGSGEHESLQTIRDALTLIRKSNPDLIVDGEIQVDAAINPKASAKKCPDSPLKGQANVLIFPEITVGNVLVHSLLQWTDYPMYGSFPVGLSKPVVNGGRSMDHNQIYSIIVACAAEANL